MISDIFRKKIDQESKVERVVDEASTLGQASLRIIAKNTLTFKALSRDLRSLNKAFSNFVKLHNIEPAEGQQLSDLKKELSSHDDMKTARVKVTKVRREKPKTFMANILDKLLKIIFAAVVGTLLAAGYVTYKLVEIITPFVSSFIDSVVDTVTSIGNALINFYKETDFADLLLSSFKKYLGFISLGIISEKDVDNALSQAGSFYKTIIDGIGIFLKDAISWLAPKLQAIGRYIGKDLLGVDIDKIAEKRSAKEGVIKRSQEMQKEYDILNEKDKELTKKKTDLTDELTKKKEELQKTKQEEEKKKAEEEEKKRGGFFDRLFKKEEKKKEEVKSAPAPTPEVKKEEVKPVVKKEEVKPAPKVDVSKVPADDGSKKPLPKPVKEEKEEKEKKEEDVNLQSVVKVMSGVDVVNLNPDFSKRIAMMAKDFYEKTKVKLQVNSGYRSPEKQKELYDEYIAKGGKNNPKLSPVAKPGASYHEKKVAVDIQATSGKKGSGSPKGFLNELAGYVDEPTGWLEKFGLSRPVTSAKYGAEKKEDWHIQIAGSAPTPDAPKGSTSVPDSQGKPVDVSTGKQETGTELAKASSEVSEEQRKQSKPKNPKLVNARITNNNVSQTDTNLVAAPA